MSTQLTFSPPYMFVDPRGDWWVRTHPNAPALRAPTMMVDLWRWADRAAATMRDTIPLLELAEKACGDEHLKELYRASRVECERLATVMAGSGE